MPIPVNIDDVIEDTWLGYLEEYYDDMTQGESIDELKENLWDIYAELTSGKLP